MKTTNSDRFCGIGIILCKSSGISPHSRLLGLAVLERAPLTDTVMWTDMRLQAEYHVNATDKNTFSPFT